MEILLTGKTVFVLRRGPIAETGVFQDQNRFIWNILYKLSRKAIWFAKSNQVTKISYMHESNYYQWNIITFCETWSIIIWYCVQREK